MKVTRKEIAPLVFLTCLTTDKFKTGHLSINILSQLDRETASKNALIPYVLRRGSAMFPDMESISAALDLLYGARIEPIVGKKGEIQTVGLVSSFIDDSIAPNNEEILTNIAELMTSLLITPNTRGGLLNKEYVESEKEKLIDRIRAVINEKRSYSVARLKELMCYSENYAVDRLGTEAEADSISYKKLTTHYRNLLADSPIEITYCGSHDADYVENCFETLIETLPRSDEEPDLSTEIRLNTMEEEPRYYVDELDVTQGKLALGFRLGDYFDEDNIPAILVFNAIYGGSVNSKLFMNVREKLSLCYFASSGVDLFKGLMLVSSGIEFEKYDEALSEIIAQLNAVRAGDFTDEELIAAKKSISSDLRASMDSPMAMADFWLGQNIRGLEYDPEELASLVEMVKADEVITAANSCDCDTIYFLKGLQEVENGEN